MIEGSSWMQRARCSEFVRRFGFYRVLDRYDRAKHRDDLKWASLYRQILRLSSADPFPAIRPEHHDQVSLNRASSPDPRRDGPGLVVVQGGAS